MTLVDTSVWVDHLRLARAQSPLPALLVSGLVMTHPFVIGELALGHLCPDRASILRDLAVLPGSPVLSDAEVHALIDANRLSGTGIGWVDAHLLGSALIGGVKLLTGDRRLRLTAIRLGVAA